MIALTLPWPVSANRYWRSFVPRGSRRAVTVVSPEAEQYRDDVAIAHARSYGTRKPMSCPVAVSVALYPARPKDWAKRRKSEGPNWHASVRSIDLDNALKVLIDALKGVAYDDDKQVFRIDATRCEPDANGARVVVTCSAIADLPAPNIPAADALMGIFGMQRVEA